MNHNPKMVITGIRHIPISIRVSEVLLSCGDFCIAEDRGNGATDSEALVDGVAAATAGGVANGLSEFDSEVMVIPWSGEVEPEYTGTQL